MTIFLHQYLQTVFACACISKSQVYPIISTQVFRSRDPKRLVFNRLNFLHTFSELPQKLLFICLIVFLNSLPQTLRIMRVTLAWLPLAAHAETAVIETQQFNGLLEYYEKGGTNPYRETEETLSSTAFMDGFWGTIHEMDPAVKSDSSLHSAYSKYLRNIASKFTDATGAQSFPEAASTDHSEGGDSCSAHYQDDGLMGEEAVQELGDILFVSNPDVDDDDLVYEDALEELEFDIEEPTFDDDSSTDDSSTEESDDSADFMSYADGEDVANDGDLDDEEQCDLDDEECSDDDESDLDPEEDFDQCDAESSPMSSEAPMSTTGVTHLLQVEGKHGDNEFIEIPKSQFFAMINQHEGEIKFRQGKSQAVKPKYTKAQRKNSSMGKNNNSTRKQNAKTRKLRRKAQKEQVQKVVEDDENVEHRSSGMSYEGIVDDSDELTQPLLDNAGNQQRSKCCKTPICCPCRSASNCAKSACAKVSNSCCRRRKRKSCFGCCRRQTVNYDQEMRDPEASKGWMQRIWQGVGYGFTEVQDCSTDKFGCCVCGFCTDCLPCCCPTAATSARGTAANPTISCGATASGHDCSQPGCVSRCDTNQSQTSGGSESTQNPFADPSTLSGAPVVTAATGQATVASREGQSMRSLPPKQQSMPATGRTALTQISPNPASAPQRTTTTASLPEVGYINRKPDTTLWTPDMVKKIRHPLRHISQHIQSQAPQTPQENDEENPEVQEEEQTCYQKCWNATTGCCGLCSKCKSCCSSCVKKCVHSEKGKKVAGCCKIAGKAGKSACSAVCSACETCVNEPWATTKQILRVARDGTLWVIQAAGKAAWKKARGTWKWVCDTATPWFDSITKFLLSFELYF